ncbi:hypothetical protein BCR41DRAFT_391071 [Lobosporangium transversale]|uniref:Uncharacterized protein n=1 Tax=Lobosporangium transversale TaxID=64571 RepID=A0A1Y2H260_9FUNG|nr:hypothetical protein BCR41DRAFT_391071 [Lobosporangium transversale]ORZ28625.1 hypothetical protein BCR41DRAFT_391071 [Lobosporangium transversale]|eukprot:XP_021886298.1 hypothetical protein BCR41DRAFT_391071 [Lobosporangium transversale]
MASSSSAREMMDESEELQEKARSTLDTVRRSGIVQNYIMPTVNWVRQKYSSAPMLIRITLMSFFILSAVPLACFAGFMGVVTLGCLIVGGIAFTIGGFAMFASAFLLPALGLVLLITGALGLFGAVVYAGYSLTSYVVGAIMGPGQKRELQRTVGRGTEHAARSAEEAAGVSE